MREESVCSHYAATVTSIAFFCLEEWKALAEKKKKRLYDFFKIPECHLRHLCGNCLKCLFLSCQKFGQISGCPVESSGGTSEKC